MWGFMRWWWARLSNEISLNDDCKGLLGNVGSPGSAREVQTKREGSSAEERGEEQVQLLMPLWSSKEAKRMKEFVAPH